MQNVVWTGKCTGCRNCEIACSYHHRKVFSPEIASIEVRKRGEGEFGIVLYLQAEDGHMACDCEHGYEFCLKYCQVVARDELKDILESRKTT